MLLISAHTAFARDALPPETVTFIVVRPRAKLELRDLGLGFKYLRPDTQTKASPLLEDPRLEPFD